MDLFRKKKKAEPLSPEVPLLDELDRLAIGTGTSGDSFPPTSPDHMADALTNAAAAPSPKVGKVQESVEKDSKVRKSKKSTPAVAVAAAAANIHNNNMSSNFSIDHLADSDEEESPSIFDDNEDEEDYDDISSTHSSLKDGGSVSHSPSTSNVLGANFSSDILPALNAASRDGAGSPGGDDDDNNNSNNSISFHSREDKSVHNHHNSSRRDVHDDDDDDDRHSHHHESSGNNLDSSINDDHSAATSDNKSGSESGEDYTDDEDEGEDGYKPGGYHPVKTGEVYNQRYVLNRLNAYRCYRLVPSSSSCVCHLMRICSDSVRRN
jgi:hypothetical protein